MWIDKPLTEATAKLKETADEFRAGLQDLTSEVAEEIRGANNRIGEAGELLMLALVVVGSLAVAALVTAIVAENVARRG